MSRTTVVLRHASDPHEKSLGAFRSWDEALLAVAAHCGRSLPSGSPVPTGPSQWSWQELDRIMDFYNGDNIYRVTQFKE